MFPTFTKDTKQCYTSPIKIEIKIETIKPVLLHFLVKPEQDISNEEGVAGSVYFLVTLIMHVRMLE